MREVLDAGAVRRWCRLAADALGRTRVEIDALNVFPVPDGDTGTNMHLTLLAAAERVGALPDDADTATTWQALAQGALLGARGNSGVILSQMLRGMAEILGTGRAAPGGATGAPAEEPAASGRPADAPMPAPPAPGRPGVHGGGRAAGDGGARGTGAGLGAALRRAAELAYQAVAHPVDGTMLSVLREAGRECPDDDADLGSAAWSAAGRARAALAQTPARLEVLARNGVVDAGAAGLCVILDALAAVVSDEFPETYTVPARSREVPGCAPGADRSGGAYEVMYLLDADAAAVDELRAVLDRVGDSLVVVGGDRLWNVHVHTDDAGAAVEAGTAAGRPYRIRVSYLRAARDGAGRGAREPGRAVVAVAAADGPAALLAEHGARVVRRPPGGVPAPGELAEAVTGAGDEVVVLPDDASVLAVAEAAAERAREQGVHVAVVPARASVQAIAALAVHDPLRRFDDDVTAMTRAAGATRYGWLETAAEEAVTGAGLCGPGDVLGLVDGDVAVIGADPADAAVRVLDGMLSPGSELVTLIVGAGAPEGPAGRRARPPPPDPSRRRAGRLRGRAAAISAGVRGRVTAGRGTCAAEGRISRRPRDRRGVAAVAHVRRGKPVKLVG